MAVGHGGFEGQQWVGEQEDIIKSFHSGECKLLVCTSILEEGIDVQQCDLVIRFDGAGSLIPFIQSRGRARKEGSRFIVIMQEAEKKQADKIRNQEFIMNLVLKKHRDIENILSTQSKNIYKKLTSDFDDSDALRTHRISTNYLQLDAVLEFFICSDGKNDVIEEDNIKDEMREKLEAYGLDVELITIQMSTARQVSSLLFEDSDLTVMVQIRGDHDVKVFNLLHSIFKNWNFKLTDQNLPVFSRFKIGETEDSVSQMKWQARGISSGYFADKQNFKQKYKMEVPMNLEFSPQNKKIKVLFIEEDTEYSLEFSLLRNSTQGIALATWNKLDMNLFIPLENMPIFKVKTEDNFIRVTSHDFLTSIAKFPVLVICICFKHSLEALCLREIFEDSYSFPLSTFDSRIAIEEEWDLEENIGSCIAMPSNPEDSKELLDLEWEVYIKTSDFSMHPNVLDANYFLDKIRSSFVESNNLREAKNLSMAVSLANRDGKTYWTTFKELVEAEYNLIRSCSANDESITLFQSMTGSNQILVKRLIVTPTRFVYPPSVPMSTNRMTRMLNENLSPLITAYTDEYLDRPEKDEGIIDRVKTFHINGMEIADRHWHYLLSTGSQLRESKGFFINVSDFAEIKQIRNQIIKNPEKFKSSAKYSSRLGLFGTSDQSAGFLPPELLESIPDEEAQDGSLVTDGAGYIKETVALDLFQKCKMSGRPSAFQFRCGGKKGVFVVLPDNHPKFSGKTGSILYRDSQHKFDSDHYEMGIVKETQVHKLSLNRQIITLLESLQLASTTPWNITQTFIENQDTYLDATAKILEDKADAASALQDYLQGDFVTKVSNNFDICEEPFFFRLLRCLHKIKVSDLCRKANLPVNKGCLVMGIPDYSDKLKTDEVFLQICKDGYPPNIITGSVIVYRNPCLDPGDVRLVKAVDISDLHYSKNVLILPGKNSTYSLAASCSGGDLDGDQFSVIWDEKYLPPSHICKEPEDYSKHGGSSLESETATSETDLANFFTDCMSNSSLGQIANKHLALCDIQDLGAMDPLCIELARQHSIAVDSVKTGIQPRIPTKADQILKSSKFPDFMEKNESYPSDKVLGFLYRHCKSFLFTYDLDEIEKRKIPLDISLDTNVSPEILAKSEEVYKLYIVEMRKLMNQFSLKQEEEVWLGRALVWQSLLSSSHERSSQFLQNAFHILKSRFQNIFMSLVSRDNV